MRTMGLDLGIKKIAWAVWDDDLLVETGAYESDRSQRHHQMADIQVVTVAQVNHFKPDAVWIEETLIGNNRKYSIKLSQTMGAVMSALGYMGSVYDFGVFLVNNKTWKKEIVGSGNADKETVRNYLYQRDGAYAVLCDYDQDRYDAACIGYYGVVIAKRAEAMAHSG